MKPSVSLSSCQDLIFAVGRGATVAFIIEPSPLDDKRISHMTETFRFSYCVQQGHVESMLQRVNELVEDNKRQEELKHPDTVRARHRIGMPYKPVPAPHRRGAERQWQARGR
jgi:hypothetical protein